MYWNQLPHTLQNAVGKSAVQGITHGQAPKAQSQADGCFWLVALGLKPMNRAITQEKPHFFSHPPGLPWNGTFGMGIMWD